MKNKKRQVLDNAGVAELADALASGFCVVEHKGGYMLTTFKTWCKSIGVQFRPQYQEDDASESGCFKPEGLTVGEWVLIIIALLGIIWFVLGWVKL